MRHFLFACVVSLATLVLLCAPQVRADGTDTFTFTEPLSSTDTISYVWQLPASPTPDPSNVQIGLGFALVGVPVSTFVDGSLQSTTPSLDTFLFFANGFGTSLLGTDGMGTNFGSTGGQLYYGVNTENMPTFIPGTYSGVDTNAPNGPVWATLTISTPEPSSLLMLFAGFLALAGALALRKVQA
jgi:hypothetical protein